MGKKPVDQVTEEQFKYYQELLEGREEKKREYEKLPSNIIKCFVSSKALIRIHWSLCAISGINSAYVTYKGLRAWQEYRKLNKEISKLEEQLFQQK